MSLRASLRALQRGSSDRRGSPPPPPAFLCALASLACEGRGRRPQNWVTRSQEEPTALLSPSWAELHAPSSHSRRRPSAEWLELRSPGGGWGSRWQRAAVSPHASCEPSSAALAMSFPRPLRRAVSLTPARTLRLVVLGQGAVGKTALTVRFITKRFIGDYDPTLEMIYRHTAVIDGEMVHFEILDTAGQEEDSLQIEEKIKWGDGFAVVYSVTDRCSFDEVMRLCFLINHIHSSPKRNSASGEPPVVIVGNKKDLQFDRMVTFEDGENLSKALKHPFYEISTRDSYEETVMVFNTLYGELMKQGHFSPGSFKRRASSKLMEKIPKIHANSSLTSAGRSLSFNSFRDYIPE